LSTRTGVGRALISLSTLLVTAACAAIGTRPVMAQTTAPTPVGTQITNVAQYSYKDGNGAVYSETTAVVTVTVVAVPGVVVTPKQTTPSATVAQNSEITSVFTVTNTGNESDTFVMTAASATSPATVKSVYYDVDNSGTVTPGDSAVTLGTTPSPTVAPGQSITVLVVSETNSFPISGIMTVSLTAQSVDSQSTSKVDQDTGTILYNLGSGSLITGPGGANSPPLKQVDGQTMESVKPGQVVKFTVTFVNSSGVALNNVTVTDGLPAGLTYVPGTLVFDQTPLTDAADGDPGTVVGNDITVQLATVNPSEVVLISFQATVGAESIAGQGIPNVAQISQGGATPVNTSAAVVVVSPQGVVYDGGTGGSLTIANANVMISNDNGGKGMPLLSSAGFAPNSGNANPYTTTSGGLYEFGLGPDQIGASSAANYYVMVSAPGYRSRSIGLAVTPAGNGLYNIAENAMDGQQLAEAGGFSLTSAAVSLPTVGAVSFNIPLFETDSLEINKSADKTEAEIGDIVSYQVQVTNPSHSAVTGLVVTDRLPASFHYIEGTGQLQSGTATTSDTPLVTGSTLTFQVGTIAAGDSVTLVYRVRIGVNAQIGVDYNLATASGVFPSGQRVTTEPVKVGVTVRAGVFSTMQFIIGRVFIDVSHNGRFDKGDKGVAGVRVYLSNGQSATTDSQGLYNIPAIDSGPCVITIDPSTLPAGYTVASDGTRNGQGTSRLLTTPLGGGTMLDQNFPLRATYPSAVSEGKGAGTYPQPLPEGKGAGEDTSPQPSPWKGEGARGTGTDGGASAGGDRAPGVYTVVATDTVAPVAAGDVSILSPAADAVVTAPAVPLAVRVAEGWSARITVNGNAVSAKSIGETRDDHKNQVTTYTYVGIVLKPGPNTVMATAVGPANESGQSTMETVYSAGPVVKLVLTPDSAELPANGRASTGITVRAFDAWGHPAQDRQVALQSSDGRLVCVDAASAAPPLSGVGTEPQNGLVSEQVNATVQQAIVSLKGGQARCLLVAGNSVGVATVTAAAGDFEAQTQVRFTPELRSAIVSGLAQASFGKASPANALIDQDNQSFRGLLRFFYSSAMGRDLLTLAYNSQGPLNESPDGPGLFQPDPLARTYAVYGDSSTQYDDAASDSPLYARLDQGRSHILFGDMTTDLEGLHLIGYSRKLTGVNVHLEDTAGDYATVTGARPGTAFGRDVFAGGSLGEVSLSHANVVDGSDNLILETRDRYNPEIVLDTVTLVASVDYNLYPDTGQIFFLRSIPEYDANFNLLEVVATYEYQAVGATSNAYTGRLVRRFDHSAGQMGVSYVDQEQSGMGAFSTSGVDLNDKLAHGGSVVAEYGRSAGQSMDGGSTAPTGSAPDYTHNGSAYHVNLTQPLSGGNSTLKVTFDKSDAGFLNPYGGTITPGSLIGTADMEWKLKSDSSLKLGYTGEQNSTANVDNQRQTYSLGATRPINRDWNLLVGVDHRYFTGDLLGDANGEAVTSNLVTVGVAGQPSPRLQLSASKEQNLSEADPTYPNEMKLGADYKVSDLTHMFLTERDGDSPIMPIADTSSTGFGVSTAKSETAFGVESKLSHGTSITGGYRIENGINETDSYAVLGLANRFTVTRALAMDVGFDRGYQVQGSGGGYDGLSLGSTWSPNDRFRATVRYELRDNVNSLSNGVANGVVAPATGTGDGSIISLGAAGRVGDGLMLLARYQDASADGNGQNNQETSGQVALAVRPLDSDRTAFLFSYTHRGYNYQSDGLPLATAATSTIAGSANIDEEDVISSDGYWHVTDKLDAFGRVAYTYDANGTPDLVAATNQTYLTQGRLQYRINTMLDIAGETRQLWQPSTGTSRDALAVEAGIWAMPELRIGLGYNFTRAGEPDGILLPDERREGFYVTFTWKAANHADSFPLDHSAPNVDEAPTAGPSLRGGEQSDSSQGTGGN
jgi:uncharacterized repeat protein (TIGR01451 family)